MNQNPKAIVPPDQKAVVVFTRGEKFTYDSQGNGNTGNWKVDTRKLEKVDKVIIYLRGQGQSGGKIFLGDVAGIGLSEEEGRCVIQFTHLEKVGFTNSNWSQFAGAGPNPVKYIN